MSGIEKKHLEMLYPCVRVRTDKAGGSGTVVYSKADKAGVYHSYVLTCEHVVDDLIKVDKKIKTRNTVECTLCQDCVKICPISPPAIDVDWHKNSFIFNIESNGVIPLERIILEANKILNNKLDTFLDQITKVMSEH